MCEGPSGYFYKMLSYLEERIRAGIREGRFTAAQAKTDLEVALWYSYACNNVDEYEAYTGRSSGCPPQSRRRRQPKAASGTTDTPVP